MKFSSRSAKVLVGIIFGIIIISFALSSFQQNDFGGAASGGDSVAKVDGNPVSVREYQTMLTRQLEFFSQMTGGSPLTSQQIEQFGIKQSVLSTVINQKILVNFVSKLGLMPGKDEVAAEIKNLPYFKSNNQFSVDLYKNLLSQNAYTPAQFEEMIASDIKGKISGKIFTFPFLSKNFINDIIRLKNSVLAATGVKVVKKELSKYIKVENVELDKFLSDAANKEKLQKAYQDNFTKYNEDEKIKTSHILIRSKEKESEADFTKRVNELAKSINQKNFKEQANKLSEDPSGKGKGGNLDWFSRGAMVKEFEEVAFKQEIGKVSAPVKTQFGYHFILTEDKKPAKTVPLELAQKELALSLIQETKTKELDSLLNNITSEIKTLIENKDFQGLEKLQKTYALNVQKSQTLNLYDSTVGNISLSNNALTELYKTKQAPSTLVFNEGTESIIVKVEGSKESTMPEEKGVKEIATNEKNKFSEKLKQEVIKDMNLNSKIVTYPHLL